MTSMNFSVAGCGFLGIYHIGVASCLKQHAPHLLETAKFAGASAGAIVSCCLICDCCLGELKFKKKYGVVVIDIMGLISH